MPTTRAQTRQQKSQTRQQKSLKPLALGHPSSTDSRSLQPPSSLHLLHPPDQITESSSFINRVLCKEDSPGNYSSFDLRVPPTSIPTRASYSMCAFLYLWQKFCWLCGYLLGRGAWPHPTPSRVENFERTIKVAFLVNGAETLRYAKAIFDTGNPKNLVSRAFVEQQFNYVIPPQRERHILDHPGNGKYVSIGDVEFRWTCDDDNRLFGQRFIKANFEISKDEERFEIVIGSETIAKEKLAILNVPAGFTGWRAEPPHVNGESKLIVTLNDHY